jgi:hypothetical protein
MIVAPMAFRRGNAALAFVALFAALYVAAVASSPAHTHAQAACAICVAGNLPAEHALPGMMFPAAPDEGERRTPERFPVRCSQPPYASTSNRAPPA